MTRNCPIDNIISFITLNIVCSKIVYSITFHFQDIVVYVMDAFYTAFHTAFYTAFYAILHHENLKGQVKFAEMLLQSSRIPFVVNNQWVLKLNNAETLKQLITQNDAVDCVKHIL